MAGSNSRRRRRVIPLIGGTAFTPASLFASGENGAWYDPSDLSTLYQDDAGTTPVTADGQPVRRRLDKSGNGYHQTATGSAAPTYRTDGTYHWLESDGVDDQLSGITGTALTNWTVCFGITPLAASIGEDMFLAAFTSSSDRIVINPNDTLSGSGGPRVFISGTSVIDVVGTDATGQKQVHTLLSQSGSHVYRVNGSEVGTSTNSGSANILNDMREFHYSEAVHFAKARDFGIILREGALSGDDLSNVEAYIAGKTGVTL